MDILPTDVIIELSAFLAPNEITNLSSTTKSCFNLFQYSIEGVMVWKNLCKNVLPAEIHNKAVQKMFGAPIDTQTRYWRLRYKRFILKEINLVIKSVTGRTFSVVMKISDTRWKLKRKVRRTQNKIENLFLADFNLRLSDGNLVGVVGESELGPASLTDISTFMQLLPRSTVPSNIDPRLDLWQKTLSDCVDGACLTQCLTSSTDQMEQQEEVSDSMNMKYLSELLTINEDHNDYNNNKHLENLQNTILPLLLQTNNTLSRRKRLALQLATSGMLSILYKQIFTTSTTCNNLQNPHHLFQLLLDTDNILNELLINEFGGSRVWKLCPRWKRSLSPIVHYGFVTTNWKQKQQVIAHQIKSYVRSIVNYQFLRNVLIKGAFTWGAAAVTLRILRDLPSLLKRSVLHGMRRTSNRKYYLFPESATFELLRILFVIVIHMCRVARRMVIVSGIGEIGRTMLTMTSRKENDDVDSVVLGCLGIFGSMGVIVGTSMCTQKRWVKIICGRWISEYLISSGVWLIGRKLGIPEELWTRIPTLTYLIPVGLTSIVLRLS